MHILIVPSEEFLPKDNHLLGIFQRDQAQALADYGVKVGVIGVSLRYSIFMICKAIVYKAFLLKGTNSLYVLPLAKLFKLLFKALGRNIYFIHEKSAKYNVLRATGFYWPYPNNDYTLYSWGHTFDMAIKEYISEYGRPDIIHAHNAHFAGIAANMFHNNYNIPFVITEHSSEHARNLIPSAYVDKIKSAYNNSSNVIAVSMQLGLLLESQYALDRSCAIVPNIIDKLFETLDNNIGFRPTETFTFLNIASLDENKNHKLLIKSFAKFHSKYTESILKIIGDGPLYEELIYLANELSLTSNIIFLGRLSREEVLNELLSCSTFVLSSNYETFGVVLIEALACGKPVIATKCGGPESIVKEYNGMLIPTDSEEELIYAMKKMYHSISEYDSHEIRRCCLEKYGSNAVVGSLVEHYNEILN
ncbi:glycosyltransferase [Pontibacter cellulosilyticus]|uniref:Glycosyltransferase n=1 Tax=Pontibacter cellulosilyticus TaxID=1720253 RepID=A0A923SHE6_9BACT|nr:glycosyltransferase [Pontibacter cellulosilyticus]MBC5991613.1 glycosyltransferase [Pontibacter cellulosilyticus]